MEKLAHLLSVGDLKFADKKTGDIIQLKKLVFLEVSTNDVVTFFIPLSKFVDFPDMLIPKYGKDGEIKEISLYVLQLKTVSIGNNTFKLNLERVDIR